MCLWEYGVVPILLYPCLFLQNSHNIALEAHAIKASSFNGMTCTLFQKVSPERTAMARDPDINLDRQLSFKCNVTSNLSALALKVSVCLRYFLYVSVCAVYSTVDVLSQHIRWVFLQSKNSNIAVKAGIYSSCFDSNVFASACLQNTVLEASLQLPPSLFSSLGSSGQAEEAVYKLHLLAFRNGKLFPPTGNSTVLSDGSKRRSVVTPVILTKIGKNTLGAWARLDMRSNPLHYWCYTVFLPG